MHLSLEFLKAFVFSKRAGSLVRRLAFLSVIGITVSTTAFFVVLFVMNGMNDSIRKRILALEPHVTVMKSTPDALRVLTEDPAVAKAFPAERQEVILRTFDGQFRGALAVGYDRVGYDDFLNELFKLSKTPQELAVVTPPEEDEVVIGIDLARSMSLIEGDFLTALSPESLLLPAGQTPKVAKLRVNRIVTTQLTDLDSKLVLYVKGNSALSQLSKGIRQNNIHVWLKNFDDIDDWAKKKRESGMEIQTWTEQNSALFFALKLEKTMIGVFLGLAGLISSFSILTVMSLLLSQKRKDMSLMRVIGYSELDLKKTFVRIGFMLGGAGVLCGSVLGLILSLWLQYYPPNLLPEIYFDSEIPSKVDFNFFFITLFFSLVICFLGALLPVQQILRLSITQGLRRS